MSSKYLGLIVLLVLVGLTGLVFWPSHISAAQTGQTLWTQSVNVSRSGGASQPAPQPTGQPEPWRMELPAEPIIKRKNWLADRLAQLDRLQRIAFGTGAALLILLAVLLIALSLWQHTTW